MSTQQQLKALIKQFDIAEHVLHALAGETNKLASALPAGSELCAMVELRVRSMYALSKKCAYTARRIPSDPADIKLDGHSRNHI